MLSYLSRVCFDFREAFSFLQNATIFSHHCNFFDFFEPQFLIIIVCK